eukprot:5212501-Prymnesium_polylepis.1
MSSRALPSAWPLSYCGYRRRAPITYGHRLLAGFAWSIMRPWVRAARLTTIKTSRSRKTPPWFHVHVVQRARPSPVMHVHDQPKTRYR